MSIAEKIIWVMMFLFPIFVVMLFGLRIIGLIVLLTVSIIVLRTILWWYNEKNSKNI
ncbi:hypothetical protein Shell_1451 [Staphylothermus hellenicus DSM 12710]|uniref:Uncharacterized protein n=1 Tax=Staphylothermus hellenicus (strain DSM 12710 / JCM 10830 / BK20S6-10-b1 / P8) TaxID=591019 RepID=D7D9U3_STAHD|nr:hypothetical protein Shell_1451 [Staphylothermus hellenicus DSM 12710]